VSTTQTGERADSPGTRPRWWQRRAWADAVVGMAIQRPRRVVAFWIILAAVCLPFAAQLSGALKAGGFDNPRGSAAQGQTVLDNAFGVPSSTLQIALYRPSGNVTGVVSDAVKIGRETANVVSVSDYQQDPQWLSSDKHTTFVQLGFKVDETTIESEISGLRNRLDASLRPQGIQVNVTGFDALDYDLSVQSSKDASMAELIAFPLLIIVLLIVFRSVVAMLVPVALAAVALITAMSVGDALTHVTDVSTLYENAVSLIGLAVSVDYSLFIIKRYRDELSAGADYDDALRTAMRTSGRSVLFSGFAVVTALLALFIPRIMVFSSVAMAGIAVTLITLAMSMTLLPAVLSLLGHRINSWSLRSRGAGMARAEAGLLSRLYRRPLLVLLLLVAAFAVMSLPLSSIKLQTTVASTTILPANADSRLGIERLTADLKSADLFPVQVVLTSQPGVSAAALLDSTRAAARLAGREADVSGVQAISTLGLSGTAIDSAAAGNLGALPAQAQAAFPQLWTRYQGRYVSQVVVAPVQSPDSDATHTLVRSLRAELPGVLAPGITALVTGATAGGVDFDDVLIDSLPVILGTVALITLILLRRAFSSWLLPALALALNAMVVAASVGLLTLISQDGLGRPVDSITPTLVFAIMFGLSMDYMVIMVSRMRELAVAHGDHREAVIRGVRGTAGLVNGAALIMLAVFVSFLSAKISVVQQLGIALSIAVVLDAVVIRLIVMPSALLLIGPRVWGRLTPR
jgi:RND superfamily putative drug exporter